MRIYVADTGSSGNEGAVHILDTETNARITTLKTGYCPTVAASSKRRHFFLAHSPLANGVVTNHEIVVYDAESLQEKDRYAFQNRFLYNVAPSSDEMVVNRSGDRCFIAQCEILGDDEARYEIAALDIGRNAPAFMRGTLELPEAPNSFNLIPRRSDKLWFDVSGQHMEAVGIDRYRSGRRTTAKFFQTAAAESPEQAHDMEFSSVAAVALGNGKGVAHITRDGQLRIADTKTDQLSESVQLDVGDLRVPLHEALSKGDHLYVGLASEEGAARGQIELVMEFRIANGVFRERAFGLSSTVEKMRLGPDEDTIVTLSREDRRVDVIDLDTLATLSTFADVGTSPVQFAVSR